MFLVLDKKEKKMNTKPKILLFMFVAVGMFFSGCAVNVPLAGEEAKEGIYSKTEMRLGIEPIVYKADLGEKIKTTPVHPHDFSFLSGATSTEPDKKTTWAPTAGLFGSIGSKNLRVVGGVSGRWNMLHHDDGFREGFYDTKQQASDIRPASKGSFVFTQLVPDVFTFIPSVGLEGEIKNLTIGATVGFPYMGWTARSGHDRWGSWETVQDDSWRGFGTRYTGTLGFNLSDENDDDKFFISVFYEEYRPEFAGEKAKISGIGGFIGFIHRW